MQNAIFILLLMVKTF